MNKLKFLLTIIVLFAGWRVGAIPIQIQSQSLEESPLSNSVFQSELQRELMQRTRWTCTAVDAFGNRYSATAWYKRTAQSEAVGNCYDYANSTCELIGCWSH